MSELPNTGEGTAGLRDQVRDKVGTVASGAKEKASAAYSKQKESIVGDVENLAQMLRRAGQEMNGSPLSRLTDTVADQLESVGRVVGGKDLDTIIRDVESFARRNPAAFLSGAAALGFMAARFLKSSSQHASIGSADTASMGAASTASASTGSTSGGVSGGGMSTGSMPTGSAAGFDTNASIGGSVSGTGSMGNTGTTNDNSGNRGGNGL